MENKSHCYFETKAVSLALLSFLAITFSEPALAQFKWKDSNGRWVYSDQPPPAGANSQTLATPAPTARPVSQQGVSVEPKTNAIANSDDKALAAKRKELETAQAAKDKQELAKKNQATCDLIRANLKALQGEVRVRATDANGDRNFLSEQEKQSRAITAQKDLSTNCNG
jgi:Domain of unknown function (DUF4124)